MNKPSNWVAVVLGLVWTGSASASDHSDSPAGGSDPAGDITDLFAFKNPAGDKLVLVLDTVTSAPKTARFSDQLTYSFRVRPDAKEARQELRIDCQFDHEPTQHGKMTRRSSATSRSSRARPIPSFAARSPGSTAREVGSPTPIGSRRRRPRDT